MFGDFCINIIKVSVCYFPWYNIFINLSSRYVFLENLKMKRGINFISFKSVFYAVIMFNCSNMNNKNLKIL